MLLKPGTVGKAYAGVQNAILDPDDQGMGELISRARNIFIGYHKDEAKTKGAFTEDGWYRTGDLASLDEDGFFTLHGRIKELIITSGGENIAPLPIEARVFNELKDIVTFCVLVGEARKYLTCLLTLQVKMDDEAQQATNELEVAVVDWAAKVVGAGFDSSRLVTISDFVSGEYSDKLKDAIHGALNRANDGAVSQAQRVQKFAIVPTEFTLAGGELGPTLKVKRFFVYDKYKDLIEQMYQN